MALGYGSQDGPVRRAASLQQVGIATARVKGASRRNSPRPRRLARDRLETQLPLAIEPRDRLEETPRIRMLGPRENHLNGATFHHLPAIHDDNVIGDLRRHAEVVGDENDAGVVLALKVLDEAQNLRLYCHVERCGRLIRDKQASAHEPAPLRSSPADACRRKADEDNRAGASRGQRNRRDETFQRHGYERPLVRHLTGSRGYSRRSASQPGSTGVTPRVGLETPSP